VIQVFVADDHAVVREGIKRIIASAGDLTVAGEAANGEDLVKQLATGSCDVVVMDLSMPGLPGLEVLQEIRRSRPKLPVLVLSMYPADQYAVRTLKAGASGYLHKGGPPEELITAIRRVVTGRRYVTDEVAQCLAAHVDAASEKPPHERLSNREFQVLCLLASGKSASEIAEELGLSVKTVSTFRRRVLEKLGLNHNAELVRYALKHGLIE
jgi:two-component system, NarL family, invasion response regulator UvrY